MLFDKWKKQHYNWFSRLMSNLHAIVLIQHSGDCGEFNRWWISFKLSYSISTLTRFIQNTFVWSVTLCWKSLLAHSWGSKLKCQRDWLEWHHIFVSTKRVLLKHIISQYAVIWCDIIHSHIKMMGCLHGWCFSILPGFISQDKTSSVKQKNH